MAEITDPTVAAALRILQARNRDIRNAVTGIGDEGVNWVPGVETNSVFAVVWHALDVERSAISNAAGAPATVPARDLARKGTEAELLARLAEAENELEGYLAAITDLGAERQQFGRTTTAAAVLLGGISHVAEHVGHAALTRQMWDQYGKTGVVKGVEK